MTTTEMIPLLKIWADRHKQLSQQMAALEALTMADVDSPLLSAVWGVWDEYTKTLAREIGDKCDWLEWYCWENDMGAKGLSVESTSGVMVKVKGLRQLARVICY